MEEHMHSTTAALFTLIISVFFLAPAVFAAESATPQNFNLTELTELYNNTVIPLWKNAQDKEPLCAISYLTTEMRDIFGEQVERSYLVSAGHCGGGVLRKSESSEYVITVLGTVVTGTHDELIASVSDWRERITYFGPPRSPRFRETVYAAKTLMRPDGRTELQQLEFVGENKAAKSLLFRGEVPVRKGMSGSPVVSSWGEIIGIIVRIHPTNDYLYEVVPAEMVMKTFLLTRE